MLRRTYLNVRVFPISRQWCFMFLILFLQKLSADWVVVWPHLSICLSKQASKCSPIALRAEPAFIDS